MKQTITSKGAPAAIGPYSHAVVSGNLLYTSGQIPLVPETGKLIEGGIEEQTRQVFKNLKAVLNSVELDFSDVIKTTVFLNDIADFLAVNIIYGEFFKENPPARSCVQVAALPSGAKIEIELIASKP